uniref:Heterokaryon incompatibility protein 6, OR allele n=1 Tax=Talaromyces marneffei PM1 TaxID=1077442 RepID=A0A093VXX3_TALMA
MDGNHTATSDLCESCKTIPSLRELNSKPQFRVAFKTIAEENAAVELFGNLSFPKETESLQSLTLVSGSKDFMLYLFVRHDNPAAEYVWGRLIDIDPSADEAVSLIKTWLSTCESNHPECGMIGKDIALPTYLIDLGENSPGQEHPPKLCLIQTSPTQQDRRYIALSYVWGVASQPLMLTKNTKSALMEDIPEAKLPQTHRDAIRVARWLNVRYLWIDALCIIQDDDKANKMKEIGRMHLTFGNSFLTVQASRAASVHDGFLSPRTDSEEVQELPYPSIAAAGGSRVFVRTKIAFLSDGPTGARAWCYEESILPLRILSYTKERIRFRCMKHTCDDYGRISKSTIKTPHVFLNPPPWYKGTSAPKSAWLPDPTLDLLKAWYSILDLHYTPRLLTKPGDRLVAIGGLVRRFRDRMPGAYIAGLWQVDLPWGLLWECRRGKSSGFLGEEIINASGQTNTFMLAMTRPDYHQKRAPSWSWAALNGAVSHRGVGFRYHSKGELIGTKRRIIARIDEVPCPLANGSAGRSGLGEFEGNGALYITAPLFLMDVVYKTNEPERWDNMYERALAAFQRNDVGIGKRPLTILLSPQIDNGETAWDNLPLGHLQLDLDEDEYKPSKVWCLLLVDGVGLVLDTIDEEKVFVKRRDEDPPVVWRE